MQGRFFMHIQSSLIQVIIEQKEV